MGDSFRSYDPLSSILYKSYNSSVDKCDVLGRELQRDTSSLTDRLISFQQSDISERDFPFKFNSLARKGYHIVPPYMVCSDCSFRIEFSLVKDNPETLEKKHREFKPDCPWVLKDKKDNTRYSDSGITTAGASMSIPNNLNSRQDLARAASTAATGISTAQLCPSQSDSRLPVPVNVKANQGRLAADSVLQVRTSNSNSNPPSEEPTTEPRILRNEPQRNMQTVDRNKPLAHVQKPKCRTTEFDTYEGRLGTFYDWPRSSPMKKEDLARAGFYYVHNNDKVKCPYCFGGIYNWEPNDDPFFEHMRHNPKCEFLKWYAYTKLTTPIVPNSTQPDKNDSTEHHTAVKGVNMLGYGLDLILKVIQDFKIKPLKTESILEAIFALENKTGKLLSVQDTKQDKKVEEIQGAIGGLDLNVENQPQSTNLCRDMNTPAPPRSPSPIGDESDDDDIYGATEPSEGASELDDSNNDKASHDATEAAEELKASPLATGNDDKSKSTNKKKELEPLDPEVRRLREEYQKLYKSNICNKCRKKPVNILFLPCRHLVACEDCAEHIDECLLCDAEIIGTVKVFLT